MKKYLSVFLVLIFLAQCIFMGACAKKVAGNITNDVIIPGVTNNPDFDNTDTGKAEGLLVYKNNAIPGGIFLYLLSQTKSSYLSSAGGGMTDDASLWSKDAGNGKTVGQELFDKTLDSALSILYYGTVAREQGLSLTQDEIGEITASLDAVVNSYGSRTAFNNEMMRFGVGYNSLREFYKLEKMAQKGSMLVLGKDGIDPITDEEELDYYRKNFITLRHLYLNTVQTNSQTGQVQSKEETDAKIKRADTIMQLIQEGKNTLADFKDESEDGFLNDSPDGITIPLGDLLDMYISMAGKENSVFYSYYFLFTNIKGFAQAALLTETGTVTRIDSEVGIFLVERTPLSSSMFENYKDAINQFILRPLRMGQTVRKLREENAFEINAEALSTYNIESTPVQPGI